MPLRLDQYPYYEAHGLSIAAFANRELGWARGRSRAPWSERASSRSRGRRLKLVRRSSIAYAAIVGGSQGRRGNVEHDRPGVRGEGERLFSERVDSNLPRPYDWVDKATSGGSVVVIGQRLTDPTGVQLTEFFNPSIRKVWSLDGTAINVGADRS